MKRPEMYKCPCGFMTYDYNRFAEHFVRHIVLEILYDQLRRESEGKT
jgi:hypothetical protein